MSDEGEEGDSGEKGHLSESPSPPPSVCLSRESPSSPRILNLFSSASPLLGDTDPSYHASPECLHPSPENQVPRGSPHLTPPKFLEGTGDTGSPFLSRHDVGIEALYDRSDVPFPKWRGRGAANAERLQYRGQKPHRAAEQPDQGNHYSEHIDTETNSESRPT